MAFWSFTDAQGPSSGTEFVDSYDPYSGMVAMPPQPTVDPNSGFGANFFRTFQDSGGCGSGGGGSGNLTADPFGTPENMNMYQNRQTVSQAVPYADTEVLTNPVIKRESIPR